MTWNDDDYKKFREGFTGRKEKTKREKPKEKPKNKDKNKGFFNKLVSGELNIKANK